MKKARLFQLATFQEFELARDRQKHLDVMQCISYLKDAPHGTVVKFECPNRKLQAWKRRISNEYAARNYFSVRTASEGDFIFLMKHVKVEESKRGPWLKANEECFHVRKTNAKESAQTA